MLNRGVNGEETAQMMARFASGVIAAHPDLVLWQVGTNSVLRDHPLKPHSVLLHEGIAQLKAAGADVVLIDMQFAPRVIAKPETQGMEDQIALAAKEESVDLFRRFALMRHWHDVQHIPFDVFRLRRTSLHMNDWGYACVAKLLAAGDRRRGDPSGRRRAYGAPSRRNRHCERSEAIQSQCSDSGLLRRYAPRNDDYRQSALTPLPAPRARPR